MTARAATFLLSGRRRATLRGQGRGGRGRETLRRRRRRRRRRQTNFIGLGKGVVPVRRGYGRGRHGFGWAQQKGVTSRTEKKLIRCLNLAGSHQVSEAKWASTAICESAIGQRVRHGKAAKKMIRRLPRRATGDSRDCGSGDALELSIASRGDGLAMNHSV